MTDSYYKSNRFTTKRAGDYQVPQEYASPTLAPPSNSNYKYTRECRRGECNLDMGFYLMCGECGWLIDTCEPYWISDSNHKCYHSCCASDKFAVEVLYSGFKKITAKT